MFLAYLVVFVVLSSIVSTTTFVDGHALAPILRGSSYISSKQSSSSDVNNLDRQLESTVPVPEFGEDGWTRMIDFPLQVGESQGALLGCDLVSVGGFFLNFASGPRITYMLDLCNPTSQWRLMAEHPIAPFLTHAAHAHKGDDLLYLCGGYLGQNRGKSLDDCHVFNKIDGPNGSWRELPSLPKKSSAGGMIYIESQNRLLYALGAIRKRKNEFGVDQNHAWTLDLDGLDLDDPTSGSQWQPRTGGDGGGGAPYMGNHVTALVAKDCSGNKHYYFFGGQVGEEETTNNIDLIYEYIPDDDTFIQRQSLPEPRGHTTTANVPYGCGFITIGGSINRLPAKTDDVLYYDIDSDTWTRIGSYPELIKTPICGIVSDVLYCASGYIVESYKVDLSFSSTTSTTTIEPTSAPTMTPLTTTILDTDLSTYDAFDGYQSDVFRSTSNPIYGGGRYSSSNKWIAVWMGGIDDNVVMGMSAGHTTTYTLTNDGYVTVHFRYKVVFTSDMENGEDTEVLLGVDDIIYVVDTLYGSDDDDSSSTTTGFITATINLGLQLATNGPYKLTLGGYLSKKDESIEKVRIVFDDVIITSTSAVDGEDTTASDTVVILDTDFGTSNDFNVGYVDDVFHNTNNPIYSGGWWSSKQEWIGIRLGGIDDNTITDMSGGHKTSYTLNTDSNVTIEFNYRVFFDSDFETDEDVEVLCSVDDTTTYIIDTFYGDDNKPPTTTRSFQRVKINLGILESGNDMKIVHELILGGYLSKKDEAVEKVRILFDDVYITATPID